MSMKLSLDNAFADSVPLDLVPEPFLFDLNWSAQALINAVNGKQSPLPYFQTKLSANDAHMHHPRRCWSFLVLSPMPSRFRIGG
jgi:hypothetical protein